MKKSLLATTLLVATAGVAAADVTVSGSGRFGLVYSDNGSSSDTQIDTRLTLNFDASMTTDGGITFGGRIRMRHNEGDTQAYVDTFIWNFYNAGARLSAAKLYMESGGLRVEVGNADGAFDDAGLIWNSEIGFTSSSLGDPITSYWAAFNSNPYSVVYAGQDPMGVFVSYTAGSFTARASTHTWDQNDGSPWDRRESSISIDYSANGLSLGAAYVTSENPLFGFESNNYFVGAAYAIGDATNVGLNLFDGDSGRQITLYGNHAMGNGVTIAGYVTDIEGASDTGFGLGGSYDLGGGASIAGAYHVMGDYSYADLGVNFSF